MCNSVRLALHDAKTGLYHRRFLDAAVVREISFVEREKIPRFDYVGP